MAQHNKNLFSKIRANWVGLKAGVDTFLSYNLSYDLRERLSRRMTFQDLHPDRLLGRYAMHQALQANRGEVPNYNLKAWFKTTFFIALIIALLPITMIFLAVGLNPLVGLSLVVVWPMIAAVAATIGITLRVAFLAGSAILEQISNHIFGTKWDNYTLMFRQAYCAGVAAKAAALGEQSSDTPNINSINLSNLPRRPSGSDIPANQNHPVGAQEVESGNKHRPRFT